MGPIVILDKSTFQSLSWEEHIFLDNHFMENLTPILGMEILGDLRRETPESRTAEQMVADLARKFGGSGPATNVDYRNLCIQSLIGNHFPLSGRIIPQGSRSVQASDGSHGVIVDLSPLNRAIMRWGDENFEEFEREFAGFWRDVTRNLELDSFQDQLNAYHIILPRVDNLTELKETVDRLLDAPAHQDVWFSWLLNQLSVPADYELTICSRWETRSSTLLKDFSPYSWHCIRVLLMLLVATRHRLIRWQPTNLLDAQYLYYLPFCMVFVSNDHLHCDLAPLLTRDDQSFVVGEDLKTDIQHLADFYGNLTDTERKKLVYALGSRPPPRRNSVIHELWKKHTQPWRPGRGSLMTSLSDAECEEATRWVEQMFREVEGDEYFE